MDPKKYKDQAFAAFDIAIKTVEDGIGQIKTRFGNRVLKIEMGGEPVLDISFDKVDGKFTFHPKNGRFKISGKSVSFGRRNYHKTTVNIDL